MRKHAQIIYGCAGGKEDFSRYWPIPEVDSFNRVKGPTREQIKKIMQDARRREAERRLMAQMKNN